MNQPQRPQTRLHTLRNFAAYSLAAALLLALTPALIAQAPAPTVATLRKNFVNPPNDARPMVRWWWFGTAVVKPEILRELQQMKADGIQGAELAFEYPQVLDDPAKGLKNLPFLSPEMLDDVNYAQAEGRKLGLRIDVTLCSGWPYGGPHITLAEASTASPHRRGRRSRRRHYIAVPTLAAGKSVTDLSATRFVINGQQKLAEGDSILSAVLATCRGPRTRSGRGGRGRNLGPPAVDWTPASAQPLTVSGTADNRRALRQAAHRACSSSKATPASRSSAPPSVPRAGSSIPSPMKPSPSTSIRSASRWSRPSATTPPYAIFSDSLEAFGADWTPKLPDEFKKRRGYDLIPHLPELVAGGSPRPRPSATTTARP